MIKSSGVFYRCQMSSQEINGCDISSCEAGMSRKEFFELVVKRAAMTGALALAPAIADKFLVPPAYAATSTCSVASTNAGPNAPDSASSSDYLINMSGEPVSSGGTVEQYCSSLISDTMEYSDGGSSSTSNDACGAEAC